MSINKYSSEYLLQFLIYMLATFVTSPIKVLFIGVEYEKS